MVEFTSRTQLTMLRTVLQSSSRSVGRQPALILFAYHTTRHHVTGLSPFELMFGCAPSDLQNCAERTRSKGTTPAVFHESLAARLANYREWVDAQLAQCSADIEQRGPSATPCVYQSGEPVWPWDSAPRHKLAPRWLGGGGRWIRCLDQSQYA